MRATTARPPRTRRLGRTRTAVTSLAVVAATLVAGTSPAWAESDSLGRQCIVVGGYERACVETFWVNWGSGLAWNAGGRLTDSRADSWHNTVEVQLNRKWSANTHWLKALSVRDWQTQTSSISGYDTTYGAWVRLCTVNQSGTKYCNASRYVTDNS